MLEKYLPIGSVVLLKYGNKKLMINGYACKDLDSGDKIFDYSACVYPEGVVSFDRSIVFDHEQIERVFFVGYVSEEEESFMIKLKEGVEELKKEALEKDDFAEGVFFDNKKSLSIDELLDDE